MMKRLAVAVMLLASASISFGQAAGGGVPGPSSGGPPTGAAGGVLTGTYPDPSGLTTAGVQSAVSGQAINPSSTGVTTPGIGDFATGTLGLDSFSSPSTYNRFGNISAESQWTSGSTAVGLRVGGTNGYITAFNSNDSHGLTIEETFNTDFFGDDNGSGTVKMLFAMDPVNNIVGSITPITTGASPAWRNKFDDGAGNTNTFGAAEFTGTPPTITGCGTISAQSGGTTAGTFTTSTTGTCTAVFALPTMLHGYTCVANDITKHVVTNILMQSASSVSSCTVTGTTVASDVITFAAWGW